MHSTTVLCDKTLCTQPPWGQGSLPVCGKIDNRDREEEGLETRAYAVTESVSRSHDLW